MVGEAYRTAMKGERQKDLVCLILFLTIMGVDTQAEAVHSGSFSDSHSLHVVGIFTRYTLCLQIVFRIWKDRHVWHCCSQMPTASATFR
jgi:hypothetical protein